MTVYLNELAERMVAIVNMEEGDLKNMGRGGNENILNTFDDILALKQWFNLVDCH